MEINNRAQEDLERFRSDSQDGKLRDEIKTEKWEQFLKICSAICTAILGFLSILVIIPIAICQGVSKHESPLKK